MKCKKIFALLLSLCMVLSTFVAVSAQEQVQLAGDSVTIVDISKDFDAADASMKNGAGMSTAGIVADPAGIRQGTVYGGACDGSATGYFGFELVDTQDNSLISLYPGYKISLTMDIYTTTAFTPGNSGNTNGVLVRAGESWAPAGSWKQILPQEVIPANEWKTINCSFIVPEVIVGKAFFVQVRPNISTSIYVDNLRIKVEGGTSTVLTDMNLTMDSEGLQGGPDVTAIEYVDGAAVATLGGTGNNSMVGSYIYDAGGKALTLAAGDVVEWSVKINPSMNYTLENGTKSIIIRTGGGDAFAPSGNFAALTTGTAPADTWTTFSGKYVVPASNFNVSGKTGICIRTQATGTIKVDDLKIKVTRPARYVEAGWEELPSGYIPYTVGTLAGSATAGTYENGALTITYPDMVTKANGNPSSVGWSAFMALNTSIGRNQDFKVSFDYEMDGLNNSLGSEYESMNLRVRLYSQANLGGATVGVQSKAIPTSDDKVRVEFNSKDLFAAAAGSTTHNVALQDFSADIACIGIVPDVGSVVQNAKSEDTAFMRISNIKIEYVTNLSYSAQQIDENTVQLTIENTTAEDYKFAGRFFAAEYNGNELVQFANYGDMEYVVEAGDTRTCDLNFENPTTGTVKAFLWEPGTVASFADLTLF